MEGLGKKVFLLLKKLTNGKVKTCKYRKSWAEQDKALHQWGNTYNFNLTLREKKDKPKMFEYIFGLVTMHEKESWQEFEISY